MLMCIRLIGHGSRRARSAFVSAAVFTCLQLALAGPVASQVPATPEAPAPLSITLPNPTGSYAIGRETLPLVDRSRPEVMTTDPGDHREVLLHIWYPAERNSGVRPAPYIDIDPQDPVFQNDYRRFGPERLPSVGTHAMENARIAGAQRHYPVVLFSHGLGTVSSLYSTFIENLASHGYVVVGVESPYYASAIRFPDGRVVTKQSRRPTNTIGASAEEQEQLRSIREEEGIIQAQDLVFVLNELEGLNRTDADFRTRLDLRHVGVFGHSRGGFAAPHACYLDPRFKACLNLDGYPHTGAVTQNGIRQPYMFIQEQYPWEPPATAEQMAEAHQTPEQDHQGTVAASREWDATFRRMGSTTYVVTVEGAQHMSFSDAPYIAPDQFQTIGIDATAALTATRSYITAFFDHYLKGARAPLLRTRSPFPEVTVEVMEPGAAATTVFHPR